MYIFFHISVVIIDGKWCKQDVLYDILTQTQVPAQVPALPGVYTGPSLLEISGEIPGTITMYTL